MIQPFQISLHQLILSLTEAMDFLNPELADHQERTAYIALRIGRQLDFDKTSLETLFLAAALHDIGVIRVEDRKILLHDDNLQQIRWHEKMGYELLKTADLFSQAAEFIRYHHIAWKQGLGGEAEGRSVPFSSHILHLADCIERSIDRDEHVLNQSKRITKEVLDGMGGEYHPDCVQAFLAVSGSEAFWLDCQSTQTKAQLLRLLNAPMVDATDKVILDIAEVFARVVDAMSRWTATHTAGVAASAVALADKIGFSPCELIYMRTAGLLHDIGKLSVPTSILDYEGVPSPNERAYLLGHTYHTYRFLENAGMPCEVTEWAAFHHERVDGQGYPFRVQGRDLTLGARIMAVADIFTALSEDRPYRKGFGQEEGTAALERMVRDGAIDGEVYEVLKDHYGEINDIRNEEQLRYGDQQQVLAGIMRQEMYATSE